MKHHDLVSRLRLRYDGGPSRNQRLRHRTSSLDAYLGDMRQFTLRRLNSTSPSEFTLQRLTDLINGRATRPFCLTAVRKALVTHGLYDLWR